MIRSLLFLTACCLQARDAVDLPRELDTIASAASVMVDGDICQRIVTPRALDQMLHPDARDPWSASDNYDVDDRAFIATKKTLIRLARLAAYPVDVNLWMPLPGEPARVQIVIRNRYEMSQFWVWGKLYQQMFPAMRDVLTTGNRVVVREKPGFVSVLAPVRNGLGNIVGLVEVVSRTRFDERENVQ